MCDELTMRIVQAELKLEPWAGIPETQRLYRLLSEARGLRRRLEQIPYSKRVSKIYHRALRRENRRRSKYLATSAA